MRLLSALFCILCVSFGHAALGAPSSAEILAEINLARTAPRTYARLLENRSTRPTAAVREAIRFLERATPLAPLQMAAGMINAASSHVARQGPSGSRGHGNMSGRLSRHGQWIGSAGENIYYGTTDARGVVCALIVDEGVRGRGHRKNIFSAKFRVAGVACGPHARYGAMCVQDFAGGWMERGTLAGL